jgi:ankyrin repeat protein
MTSESFELINAASRSSLKRMRKAIANGADVNAVNPAMRHQFTPLAFSAMRGHRQGVELLLAQPTIQIHKGGYGLTPLRWACSSSHVDCAALLIAAGADVREVDHNGKSLLCQMMSHHVSTDILRLLCENGAARFPPTVCAPRLPLRVARLLVAAQV